MAAVLAGVLFFVVECACMVLVMTLFHIQQTSEWWVLAFALGAVGAAIIARLRGV